MRLKYPKKFQNEAEVQALLWYFLRKRGVDARLGVNVSKGATGRGARLDIVCFRAQEAVCIIECKAWTRSYSLVREYRKNNSKQLTKYREMFGIPVYVCGRASEISHVQSQVLALYGPSSGDYIEPRSRDDYTEV